MAPLFLRVLVMAFDCCAFLLHPISSRYLGVQLKPLWPGGWLSRGWNWTFSTGLEVTEHHNCHILQVEVSQRTSPRFKGRDNDSTSREASCVHKDKGDCWRACSRPVWRHPLRRNQFPAESALGCWGRHTTDKLWAWSLEHKRCTPLKKCRPFHLKKKKKNHFPFAKILLFQKKS